MAEHYTMSGLISTSTIQKFSEQFESTSRVTQFVGGGLETGVTVVQNSYVEGEPPIFSRSSSVNGGGQNRIDTRSSSGSTQGQTRSNKTGNTQTNQGSFATTITQSAAATGSSRGNSASQTSDSSNSADRLATEQGMEAEQQSVGTTATSRTSSNSGSFSDANQTAIFTQTGSGRGNFTFIAGATQTSSGITSGTGFTNESGATFSQQNLGGATAAQGASGTTSYSDQPEVTSGSSTENFVPNTQTFSGTNSFYTTGSRATQSSESTASSREFKTSTYSYTESFLDTVTTEDTVFANSDTTVTAKKTTLSSETSSMNLTADTISSETKLVNIDPLVDTLSSLAASTFTILGNKGFVTTNGTGTFNMIMTNMPQSITSPGLKPSIQEFAASIIGGEDATYNSSYTFSNSPTDSIGSTTTVSFESRETNYSRATNESYLDNGVTRFSTRLIDTTTSSFYQTTFVSTRSRGRQFVSSTVTAQGSFETVNSFLTSSIESITPIIYFDGTNLLQTENREDVRVTTTGTKQFPFGLSVFGGSGVSLYQTLAKSFLSPDMDSNANKVISTHARPRNHSAIETIFNQEKAFIQNTNNESDVLFGKQFPPILKSSGTTTEGDSSSPSTTTTSGTYITGLGSIRRHISLMFTDTTFKIPNFQQSGDTGRANKTAFTIDEVGGSAAINYIETDRALFRGGAIFVGGINNVTSNGIITAEGLGKFKIGSSTISLSSNETFSTSIDFGTMKKIENEAIVIATGASRTRDFLGGGILKSDLNNATNF